MAGRIDYEERKENRIEHLQSAAAKAAERSHQLSKASSDMMSAIPMGQPIITGRGSRTTADINYRERAWNKMGKSVGESAKSDYYADKAASAESNTAISSDDPAAIEKLRKKVARLESERERIKVFNREAKKNGTEISPWYTLPYLGRDIKAAKERIAKLEKIDARPAIEDINFNGGKIVENVDQNRIQIIFDDRPDDDRIEKLKGWGFHWSHDEMAWQRFRNGNAMYAAQQAIK
jgi:hypothetical protein